MKTKGGSGTRFAAATAFWRAGRMWPSSRLEALFAAFVAMQTLVFLGEGDGFSVLFWWDPVAWPLTLALWVKDLFLAMVSGIVALVLLRMTESAESGVDPDHGEPGPVAVLTAVAAVALGVAGRFVALEQIPPGVFADTVLYALPLLREPHGGWMDGARLLESAGSGGFAVSPLLLVAARSVLWITGTGESGFRILSAVSGLVLIGTIFFLAREVGGVRVALLAASLASLGRWTLILSRWAWAEQLTVSCLVVALSLGLAAFRRRSRWLGVGAGAAAGLAIHGHSSGLVVASVLLGAATLQAVRRAELRRVVAAALLPAGLLLAGWIVLHALRTGQVGGRYAQVGFWTRIRRAELAHVSPTLRPVAALLFNLRAYSGLFLWTGDPNPRMGLPNEPVLSPTLGIAGLLGVALCFRDLTRGNASSAALPLLVLGSVAAGVFANPDGAPNSLRACALIPVAFIGAARSLRAWGGRLPSLGVRRSFGGALLGAVLLAFEVVPALVVWPAKPAVRNAFFSSETEAARLRRALGSGETILDPAAVTSPEVFEVVACGQSLGTPLRRLPRRKPAESLAAPGPERFWYVTTTEGVLALRAAGLLVSRPAGDGEGPVVVLVRRAEARPKSGPA